MNNYTTARFLCFLSLFFSMNVVAQEKNIISGFVKDNSNNPVQHATVTLLRYPDIKSVTVTHTDSSGKYNFTNITEGKYIVLVTAAGMKINQSSPFNFSENEILVPDIIMNTQVRKSKKSKPNYRKR